MGARALSRTLGGRARYAILYHAISCVELIMASPDRIGHVLHRPNYFDQHYTHMLSLMLLGSAALLAPLDGPPVLSSPVYSLATLNPDGSTNMQILTYATPVGIAPRTWALSLYRPTQTHANFKARRSGVLQLLTEKHANLVYLLGGQSGNDIDKAAACKEAGFAWLDAPDMVDEGGWAGGGPQLLPGCAAYVRLVQEDGDELRAFGEHEMAVCRVDGMLGDSDAAGFDGALSTRACRDLGLITDRGKAIPPEC